MRQTSSVSRTSPASPHQRTARRSLIPRAAIGTMLLLLLPLGNGCGRTAQKAHDGGNASDGPTTDAGGGCLVDCAAVCALVDGCEGVTLTNCPAVCQGSPRDPSVLCLAQLACEEARCQTGLACSERPRCYGVAECLVRPLVPDLQVAAFSASSPTDGQITYTTEVCNRGDGASVATTVHFYVDRAAAPRPGERGELIEALRGIPAGQCLEVSTTQTGVAAGTYRTWVQVDAEGTVVESDETNNVEGPRPVQVSGGGQLPDLTIELAAAVKSGGVVSYTVSVCNRGSAIAPPASVGVYTDRQGAPGGGTKPDLQGVTSSLPPGACAPTSLTVTLPAGTYRSWGYVDWDLKVGELVEGNNIAGPRVINTSSGFDLVVTAFDGAVVSGTASASYKATVCNHGLSPAPASKLGIYASRPNAPTVGSNPDRSINIQSLSGGDCTSVGTGIGLPAGTHTSWALIDHPGALGETDEGNNVRGPVTVKIGSASGNLRVIQFNSSTTPFGGTEYRATVCYDNGPPLSGAQISFYFNRPAAPTSATAPDRTLNVGLLTSGTCVPITTSVLFAPGNYVSWAFVDRTNAIAESNESDNVAGPLKVNVGGSGPDLVVSGLNASSGANGQVSYLVTICNKGGAASGASRFDLYFDSATEPTPASASDRSRFIGPLGSGNCLSRTINAVLGSGTYTSWGRVDRLDQVAETNENNNVGGPIKVTVGNGSSPDLVVGKLSATPSGSGAIYSVEVCNKGAGSAGSFRIGIYYNRNSAPPPDLAPNRSLFVSGLGPGDCTNRSTSVSLAAGTYVSWAYADYRTDVAESNESNNVGGPVKFTVGGNPDLVVSSFSAAPAPNGAVTYTAAICNYGQGTAAASTAHLFYNRPAPPVGPVSSVDALLSYPSLAPGACASRQSTGTPNPGLNLSWVLADGFGQVAESNESNNALSTTIFVPDPSLPDLTIASFVAAPSGGGIFYGLQVCNQGTAASAQSVVGIYYQRTTPPAVGALPNRQLSVPALAAGACSQTGTFAALASGSYNSWAQVDFSAAIKESNEANNVAGPRASIVTGGGNTACQTICDTLVQPCSLLPASDYNACIGACQSQPPDVITCALAGAQAQQCFQIIQCLLNTP